ncbi:MAG: hypothetical protein IIW10_01210 [Spirochaetaceae bacterium]|nr:hypothetical protein [Spirochaetaceae bacterium]
MRKFICFGLFLSFMYFGFSEEFLCVASCSQQDLLFTGQENGFVSVYDDSQVTEFQVSRFPIKLVATFSQGNKIACYETDGITNYKISVWDFKKKSPLFSIEMETPVSFLAFSGGGKHIIVCGITGNLQFFNASTGKSVNLIDEKLSNITFAAISKSEKTLITYSPTGILSYFNLSEKKKTRQFTTEKRLENVAMSPNNVNLVGLKDNCLYKVSAVTGEAYFAEKTNCDFFIFDDKRLLFFERKEDTYNVFSDEGNERTELFSFGITSSKPLLRMERCDNVVFLSTEDTVFTWASAVFTNPSAALIQLNKIEKQKNVKFLDFAISEDSLLLLTQRYLYSSQRDTDSLKRISNSNSKKNVEAHNNNIALFSAGSEAAVEFYRFTSGKLAHIFNVTPNGRIVKVCVGQKFAAVLTENSSIRVCNLDTKEIVLSMEGTDYFDISLDNEFLYLGKTSRTDPPHSILKINLGDKTREVIPIFGEIALAVSSSDSILRGIIQVSHKDSFSTAFSYNGDKITLMEVPLVGHPVFCLFDGKTFLSNSDPRKILIHDFGKKTGTAISPANGFPVKALTHDGMLFVHTTDGRLSLINLSSKKIDEVWEIKQGTEYLTRKSSGTNTQSKPSAQTSSGTNTQPKPSAQPSSDREVITDTSVNSPL